MGSVASEVKRPERALTSDARASLTTRQSSTARSGVSILVPGAVNVMTCMRTPASSSTFSRKSRSRWPGTRTF